MEVLGWTIVAEAVPVSLLERKLQEFLTIVDILATQRCMGQKDLEHWVGKLRSMHLAVPGAVEHLYHIQRALAQGGGGPGQAVTSISLRDLELAVLISANGSPSHSPVRNHLSQTHPSGVLQGFWPRGRGCVARPFWVWPQLGMASHLANGHHRRFSLVKKYQGHYHKLQPRARRPHSPRGHPSDGSPYSAHGYATLQDG